MSVLDSNNYNPHLYNSDYTARTNANDRRTVTAEHHLKHYLQGSPTTFTLTRRDTTVDSVPEEWLNKEYKEGLVTPEKQQQQQQQQHSSHMHFKSSKRTGAPLSNENEKIPTYLTPPLPRSSLRDVVAQLQQLLPRKRLHSVRNEHKLVDILTNLNILPRPEESDDL
jgi:hypothetical protein